MTDAVVPDPPAVPQLCDWCRAEVPARRLRTHLRKRCAAFAAWALNPEAFPWQPYWLVKGAVEFELHAVWGRPTGRLGEAGYYTPNRPTWNNRRTTTEKLNRGTLFNSELGARASVARRMRLRAVRYLEVARYALEEAPIAPPEAHPDPPPKRPTVVATDSVP